MPKKLIVSGFAFTILITCKIIIGIGQLIGSVNIKWTQ